MQQNRTKATAAVAAVIASGAMMPGTAGAADDGVHENVRQLEQRVETLENGDAGAVTFGGLIEVEAAAGSDHEGNSGSDIVLATVELAASARINEWTMADIVYLHEEDDTEPGEIDQGILTFASPDGSPMFVSGGLMYMPFGTFETGMVSDPLTLELAETRESALMVGYETGGLYGSLYAFNGDTREAGEDDAVEHFGLDVGYATDDLDVGIGYISSLGDTDAVAAVVDDPDAMQDVVAGYTAHAIYDMGNLTFIGEYVGAADSFNVADLAFDGNGAEPTALNLEVGLGGFSLAGREASAAVGVQQTSEAQELGLPEQKLMAALSIGMMENAALSFEVANADDYDTADGGSGESGTAFTVQLAAEF